MPVAHEESIHIAAIPGGLLRTEYGLNRLRIGFVGLCRVREEASPTKGKENREECQSSRRNAGFF